MGDIRNTELCVAMYYRYHVASISQERLDMWRDVSTINASLALPPANDYIPRNLELLASPKENTLYPSRVLKELGKITVSNCFKDV